MKRLHASIVVVSLALGACSGGTSGLVPSATIPTTASSEAASAKRGTARVSFFIRWPKTKARTHLGGRFVSPSTKSVVVQTGSGKNAVTAIANDEGSRSTLLQFDAPVGRDTFVVTLYDAFQKPKGPPAGQIVGQGEAVQTIHADKVNRLRVVIDGIVSRVGFLRDGNSLTAKLSGKPGQQILTMVGDVPAVVKAQALDADGNVIVTPAVAHSIDLQPGAASAGGVVVSRPTADSDTFTISLEGPSFDGTFGLVATATDGQGGTVTTNLPVVESQAIYVGYASGPGSKIAVYDGSGNATPLSKTAFTGVTRPVGLSYDTDDRTIFVADASGKLLAFDGAGNRKAGFPVLSIPGITSVGYFNAVNVRDPYRAIDHPQRLIVGSPSGIAEFDAVSGTQIVRAPLPFTPTAVSGLIDLVGYSASGWLAMAGDPAGFVHQYDLMTLSEYTSEEIALTGEVPAGFGTFLMPGTAGFSGDSCMNGKALRLFASCLYTVTGVTSAIVRLGSNLGGAFGLPGAPQSFDQLKQVGTLSAIAVDQLNYNLAVANASQNAIMEFSVVDEYDAATSTDIFRLPENVYFTTPSNLGLSAPTSIAVQW